MIITKVEITKNDDKVVRPKLIGTANIIIDYGLMIHDIEINQGSKGIYLIFPGNKYEVNAAYPITDDCRRYILDCILNELDKVK